MFFNTAYAGGIPLQGTDVAASWDKLYIFLILLSVFFFVLVVGAMIVFAVKYRNRPGIKTEYITGNYLLEAVWIAVPTLLLLGIFGWGYWIYDKMVATPSGAYEIRVIGKQWEWQFLYDTGRSSNRDLYVPINKPVKLVMTSEDVLHSFFIPNFRVKQDVVPGMYTTVWFEATVPGRHQVYCTEYCGTLHSGMLAQVVVLEDAQWKAWLAGKDVGPIPRAGDPLAVNAQAGVSANRATATLQPLPARGKQVFETRGCVACHSVDGSTKIGPSLSGLFGRQVPLQDGRMVAADENYLRESIEKPMAKVVQGYQATMPSFQGQINETDMTALIKYIESIRE